MSAEKIQPPGPCILDFVRRDSGSTARGPYPHWSHVLCSDVAAALWNKLTHDFRYSTTSREWLKVHYLLNIERLPDGADKQLLAFKLALHIAHENASIPQLHT